MRTALLLGLLSLPLWSQPVPLDCNQPADVTITPSALRANLQFPGLAGDAVYVRIVGINVDPGFGLSLPQIADPYGNIYYPRTQVPTNADATPPDLAAAAPYPYNQLGGQGYEFDLPTGGTFTLQLLGTSTAASGAIHVTLARLNRACSNTTQLSCGRSAGGAISMGTAKAPPAFPGQLDTYQYNVTSGDVVSFRILRVASNNTLDTGTYFGLAVYGPDGHVLNMDPKTYRLTFTVGGTATIPYPVYGRVDLTMAVTGTITLMVWEITGGRGGNYYVSATKLNGGCGGPALSCSSIQDGQINTPLSIGSYTLQASGGDVYLLRAGRATPTGSFAPDAEVYDSTGKQVDAAGPVSAQGYAVASKAITLPASGAYSVLVNGSLDGTTGGFTLSATRLNKPCGEQALTCSSIVDGAISGLMRDHVYSLVANAGDNFLLRLLQSNPQSLFRPRLDIYDATGNQLQFLNTSDLSRQNFVAPAGGTYTVVATDSYDGSQSGNFSFSVLLLNRPCNAGTLSCSAPQPGNLARSLASGVFTYSAAAGESFSVRMLPSSGVTPAVEVYDSQGNAAGQANNGIFTGVDVVKPAGGQYTIVALDNSKNPQTGSFAVDLLRTKNACGQALGQGQTASGVVSAASPFQAYTVTANAGDTLALRSASSTAGFSAQMEIYDPDGNRLDSGVFGLSRKAAASGTYTVILGASAQRTAGGYAFAWQLLNNPAAVSPLACGGTTSGSLAGANQFRYYSVAANQGDTMRILFTKTSDNFAPQIELFDPTGARVVANSDVTTPASVAGNYLVLVSPSTTAFESGSYSLAYQRPNNPCSPTALPCGQTTLRQVPVPGQMDTLTLSGTGGDLTEVRLATRSGNYSPFVELYNSSGAKLSTSSNGLLRMVLPANGTYTLLVRDRGATNLGSYRVSLQDDSNNCPVSDTEAPLITLLRPTGGEVLPGGVSFRIQWLSDDNVGVATHDIALSTDGGKTFATAVASGLSGNLQVYDWLVPSGITPSRSAVVRVTATDAAGNATSATSDLLTVIGSGFTPNATATYTYDGLNRLIGVVLGDGRTLQYTWDAAGNLVQITVTGQ
jgi:YD repeat-containing protein